MLSSVLQIILVSFFGLAQLSFGADRSPCIDLLISAEIAWTPQTKGLEKPQTLAMQFSRYKDEQCLKLSGNGGHSSWIDPSEFPWEANLFLSTLDRRRQSAEMFVRRTGETGGVATTTEVTRKDPKSRVMARFHVMKISTTCERAKEAIKNCLPLVSQTSAVWSYQKQKIGTFSPRILMDAGHLPVHGGVSQRTPIASYGLPVWAWQSGLSVLDGAKCSHYPTCSAFCWQSIKQNGLVGGVGRSISRIMSEGPGMEHSGSYDPVLVHGRWRLHDPVSP